MSATGVVAWTEATLSSWRIERAALRALNICGLEAPPSEYLPVMKDICRKDKWFREHGMPGSLRDSSHAAPGTGLQLITDEDGMTRTASGLRVITAEEEIILELGRECVGRRHTTKRVRALVGKLAEVSL